MNSLSATLRLQFHAGFTLDDALALVPYFARLGISHLYASPLLSARPGSLHGYDVIDPTRVSPALGGEAALTRLVAALRLHGMGLILDIVSNHMAVGSDNPWWQDLLSWGRRSLQHVLRYPVALQRSPARRPAAAAVSRQRLRRSLAGRRHPVVLPGQRWQLPHPSP